MTVRLERQDRARSSKHLHRAKHVVTIWDANDLASIGRSFKRNVLVVPRSVKVPQETDAILDRAYQAEFFRPVRPSERPSEGDIQVAAGTKARKSWNDDR